MVTFAAWMVIIPMTVDSPRPPKVRPATGIAGLCTIEGKRPANDYVLGIRAGGYVDRVASRIAYCRLDHGMSDGGDAARRRVRGRCSDSPSSRDEQRRLYEFEKQSRLHCSSFVMSARLCVHTPPLWPRLR